MAVPPSCPSCLLATRTSTRTRARATPTTGTRARTGPGARASPASTSTARACTRSSTGPRTCTAAEGETTVDARDGDYKSAIAPGKRNDNSSIPANWNSDGACIRRDHATIDCPNGATPSGIGKPRASSIHYRSNWWASI